MEKRDLDLTNSNGSITRRAGVVGDIHCEDEALDLVLRHFVNLGVDTILAVGDVVDGRGDVNRCCSLLNDYSVHTVAGNHDRWMMAGSMRELPDVTWLADLQEKAKVWLEELPKTLSFQTPKGALLLCHGLGENDMATLGSDDEGYALESNLPLQDLLRSGQVRFVVCGHSHQPMVRNLNSLTIVNAGSLDRRGRQVCSLIDFEQSIIQFFGVGGSNISLVEEFAIRTASAR